MLFLLWLPWLQYLTEFRLPSSPRLWLPVNIYNSRLILKQKLEAKLQEEIGAIFVKESLSLALRLHPLAGSGLLDDQPTDDVTQPQPNAET